MFCCCLYRSATGKAMKLGSKAKDVDSFVDKLQKEGQNVISESTKSRQSASVSKTTTPANRTERLVKCLYCVSYLQYISMEMSRPHC